MSDPSTDALTAVARRTVPAAMGKAPILIDAFIPLHNRGEAMLRAIRLLAETVVWHGYLGLRSSTGQRARDRIIAVPRPLTDRSNLATADRVAQDLDAGTLQDGLPGLVYRLYGVAAKDICLDALGGQEGSGEGG